MNAIQSEDDSVDQFTRRRRSRQSTILMTTAWTVFERHMAEYFQSYERDQRVVLDWPRIVELSGAMMLEPSVGPGGQATGWVYDQREGLSRPWGSWRKTGSATPDVGDLALAGLRFAREFDRTVHDPILCLDFGAQMMLVLSRNDGVISRLAKVTPPPTGAMPGDPD